MRLLAFVPLCLLLLHEPGFGMPVEVSNPVAGFLRRLEEKGVVPIGFWSTLPRDQAEVARVLQQAEQQKSRLNSWDRARLTRYLNEFDRARRKDGTVLHYEDTAFSLIAGVEYFTGIYSRDSVGGADRYAFGSFTPSLETDFQNKAYLTSSVTIGMEHADNPRFTQGNVYNPQEGLPYNGGKNVENISTFDGFRLVVGTGNSKLGIEAGQDWNEWGPGHWQHPTFGTRPYFWVSDSLAPSPELGYEGSQHPGIYRRGYRYPGEGPPIPQIRFRLGGLHWEYVKIVGQRTGLWNDSSALVIADRLQIRFGNFRLGGTEILTVGSRSPGLINYLPGVPLKLAEHEGGDQDNIAMSADAEWIWSGHGRVYGEFYMDDYNGRPLNQWGNKFATVAGVSLQDPFGLPSEVFIEYATVDPWVYQHYESNTQMNNYGALYGSGLPPNSRALNASVRFPVATETEGAVEWNFRQRDLKSKGSSIFDVHEFTDAVTKEFLARDVETRNQLTASAEWTLKRYVQLKAGAGWQWVETWRGNPGVDLSSPVFSGEVHLRY